MYGVFPLVFDSRGVSNATPPRLSYGPISYKIMNNTGQTGATAQYVHNLIDYIPYIESGSDFSATNVVITIKLIETE